MPIRSSNPLSGLSPAQIQALEKELEAEQGGSKRTQAEGREDRMEALRPALKEPAPPGRLSLFQGGLHPGSGFPLGTLQTNQGYLIVPSTKGFGFSVYAPGSTSINDKPYAKTFGTTLLGQNGEILADFKDNPSAQLPFGVKVTTHSSDPSDPFNGSISFQTGHSSMSWNVVEGVQDRIAQDKAQIDAANASIAQSQAVIAKEQAAKNVGGKRTGLGVLGIASSPLTGGITAIAGAIATGVGISKGSKAARKIDKEKAAIAQDQAQVSSAQSDADKAGQNVYELDGTRRFMSR